VRHPSSSPAIGIDLGATKIAAVLINSAGEILAERQCLTQPAQGAQAVADRISELVNRLLEAAPAPPAGIGIGSPGRVDPQQGIIYEAVNLGWEAVDLPDLLRQRIAEPLPLRIEKDTNANAIGEMCFGAAQGVADFVYLGIGSGLGAGLVANGQLIRGAQGIAADLGHYSLDPEGLPCACGLRGCAETLLSGPGLVHCVRRRLSAGNIPSLLVDAPEVTPQEILSAARGGDRLAQAALLELGQALGEVAAICAATLNPAVLVIGGGLGSAAYDILLAPARAEFARRVPSARCQALEWRSSRLKSSAIGAACLVWSATGV
jgi:glucokinase